MTKYGNTAVIQQMAWGGAKEEIPDRVYAVQDQVTALINIVLNRTEDYSTVPEEINQIANTIGSEILRPTGQKPMTPKELLEWIRVLLKTYMDQSPAGESNWGNVKIIHG